MVIGGEVKGITSDEIEALDGNIRQHEAAALQAIVAFYVATSEDERDRADREVKEAYWQAMSAKKRRGGLAQLQDEHQAQKEDLADWLRTVVKAAAS